MLIYRKGSITCMVQHSDIFKQWFLEYQESAKTRKLDKCARDLGLAKHRFDSSSRPLAYFCLTLESLIMTASRIMVERPNKVEEANAELFLRSRPYLYCFRASIKSMLIKHYSDCPIDYKTFCLNHRFGCFGILNVRLVEIGTWHTKDKIQCANVFGFVIKLRSCTTERILTAAMLSDAADEASMLTRAFDCEATDTSRVAEEISVFVHRVRFCSWSGRPRTMASQS